MWGFLFTIWRSSRTLCSRLLHHSHPKERELTIDGPKKRPIDSSPSSPFKSARLDNCVLYFISSIFHSLQFSDRLSVGGYLANTATPKFQSPVLRAATFLLLHTAKPIPFQHGHRVACCRIPGETPPPHNDLNTPPTYSQSRHQIIKAPITIAASPSRMDRKGISDGRDKRHMLDAAVVLVSCCWMFLAALSFSRRHCPMDSSWLTNLPYNCSTSAVSDALSPHPCYPMG